MCIFFMRLSIQKAQRRGKKQVQSVKGGVEQGKTGSEIVTVTVGLGRET